jgi:tetratricopeptide (TPR) repeat protein
MLLGQFERAREDFAVMRALARETGQPRFEAVALDRLGHSFRQQDKIAPALEHLESALGLSREVGDPSLTGRILNDIGFTYFSGSRHEEAILAHEEARRLLEGCGDVVSLAASLNGLGENLTLQGRFQAGIRWLSESAKVSEQVGNRSLAGENHYMIAIARWVLGDYSEAQAEVHRSVITLAEIGDAWNSSFALQAAAGIAITLGEFGAALEYAMRGLSLARQIGAVRPAVRSLGKVSTIHRELEDYHGAWQADHEAAELCRTTETEFGLPEVLSMMALDAAALKRMDDAMAYIGDARRVLNESQSRFDYPEQVTHAEGRVLLAMGRPAEARTAAKILLGLIDETGIVLWRVPALQLWADAASALGDHDAAIPSYLAAAEEAERMGRVPALWRTLAGLAEAQKALGRAAEAATCAVRAREIVDRLAATVPDERLRALFLQSPKVQRIISLGSVCPAVLFSCR